MSTLGSLTEESRMRASKSGIDRRVKDGQRPLAGISSNDHSYVTFFYVYFFFIMFMNPKIFKQRRFNSYITEYQKEHQHRLSRERNCSKTELLREALHYFLRENGLDDGLSYDEKDREKWLEEMVSSWK